MDPAALATPLPDLVLWRGDGCHLCDDARKLVTALLAERAAANLPVPALVECRIADLPAVERELLELIPVLEFDGRRLPLALRAGPVRAFLAAALDGREVTGGHERVGTQGAASGARPVGGHAPVTGGRERVDGPGS